MGVELGTYMGVELGAIRGVVFVGIGFNLGDRAGTPYGVPVCSIRSSVICYACIIYSVPVSQHRAHTQPPNRAHAHQYRGLKYGVLVYIAP